MVTHKEMKEKKRAFVLLSEKEVLGVFGSFKKAVDYLNAFDSTTPKYWTLVRNRQKRTDINGYSIQEVKKF